MTEPRLLPPASGSVAHGGSPVLVGVVAALGLLALLCGAPAPVRHVLRQPTAAHTAAVRASGALAPPPARHPAGWRGTDSQRRRPGPATPSRTAASQESSPRSTDRRLPLAGALASLSAAVTVALGYIARRPKAQTPFAMAAATGAPTPTVSTAAMPLISGLTMECLVCGPSPSTTPADQPVVVFVHGSLHGAWCWAEHWMPFLAARGIHSVALNLRGSAGLLPTKEYNEGRKVISLKDHVQDIAEVVHRLAVAYRRPIALAGHSFGALYLMKLMERPDISAMVPSVASGEARLVGLALLCPVPPGGNGPTISRMIWGRPALAWKITWGFVAKGLLRSVGLCRDIFFDPEMPDSTVARYMAHFQRDGQYSLDLRETNANLPQLVADETRGGQAAWVGPGGLDPRSILVLGAERDVVVDREGLEEAAQFCGQTPMVLPGVAHDVMLDSQGWAKGAAALHDWLRALQARAA
eukprot:EG_transcript_11279